MTDVKICGMMAPEDLDAARRADYLGFVVESDSFRSLPLPKAKALMASCSAKRVAVTSCANVQTIISLVNTLEPDIVQVHSLLSAAELLLVAEECPCEVWGLVPIGGGDEVRRALSICHVSDALVLDTHGVEPGGTGRTHDWKVSRRIGETIPSSKVILAGGLSPNNVAEAIRSTTPHAVDVSSGVERNRRKDPALVSRFIRIAKEVAL